MDRQQPSGRGIVSGPMAGDDLREGEEISKLDRANERTTRGATAPGTSEEARRESRKKPGRRSPRRGPDSGGISPCRWVRTWPEGTNALMRTEGRVGLRSRTTPAKRSRKSRLGWERHIPETCRARRCTAAGRVTGVWPCLLPAGGQPLCCHPSSRREGFAMPPAHWMAMAWFASEPGLPGALKFSTGTPRGLPDSSRNGREAAAAFVGVAAFTTGELLKGVPGARRRALGARSVGRPRQEADLKPRNGA